MLQQLYIKNFALIDELKINFDNGLSVITGETGAGKSILLGALKLILGNRADHSSLKNTDQKCIVEGVFDITPYGLKAFFESKDLDFWEETIIRREVSPQGKSRSFINDSPITLDVMKDLGKQLIDIHSQHQSLQINDAVFQLSVIDALAGNKSLKKDYAKAYECYSENLSEFNALKSRAIEAKKEEDFFQFQFDELSALNLENGEAQTLSDEQEQLANSEEILRNFSQMEAVLSEQEGSVVEQLQILKKLFADNSRYLQNFQALNDRFQSTAIELEDIGQELSQQAAQYEFDPDRQQYVEDRLGEIHRLQQKHQLDKAEELIDLLADFDEKLQTIANYDEQIVKLETLVKTSKETTEKLASELQQKRLSVLSRLEKSVVSSLRQLGIPHASFKVEHKENEELQKNGIDTFKFLFSANKGIAPQQLEKTASGGEISRLVLSVKALLASKEKMPTIIFDEIDTGVSGEIADQMGSVLNDLSKNMQVISITHLPQIAAKGKAHFYVYKADKGERALTKMKKLDEQERLNEVAKMLSGKNLSSAALNNAKELLNQQ